MNNLASRLKAYIDTHPFDCGDSDCQTVMDQLYQAYQEFHNSSLTMNGILGFGYVTHSLSSRNAFLGAVVQTLSFVTTIPSFVFGILQHVPYNGNFGKKAPHSGA